MTPRSSLSSTMRLLILSSLLAACKPSTALSPTSVTLKTTDQPGQTIAPAITQVSTTVTTAPKEAGTPTQSPTPTLGAPICPAATETTAAITTPAEDYPGSPSQAMESKIHAYITGHASAQGLQTALSGFRFNLQGDTWITAAQVYETDVTGDQVPEIVLGLLFSSEAYDFSDGFLWVFSCSEGTYQKILQQNIGSIFYKEEDGLRAVVDMNQNGLAEIVYSMVDNIAAHGYFTRPFTILEWDGIQFQPRIKHPGFYDSTVAVDYATVYNGDGEILDTDGDGNLELVLSNGIAGHYGGPQRRRTDIFAWDGETYSLARWEHEPPSYRFQAVQDGDDATRFGDYDRALAFYQQAIFDEELFGWQAGYFLDLVAPTPPVPDPEERPRLEAYSRYRILLVHAVQGNLSAAQVVYDTLQTKFPPGVIGYSYAEMATLFWDEFTRSEEMSSACEQVIEYVTTFSDEVLRPLGSGFYGEQGFYYEPADVCPFLEP